MKKIILFLLLSIFGFGLGFSQDKGITYQAVIYHPGGEELPGQNNSISPLVNSNICLKFSFKDYLQNTEYQEIIRTRTDDFGLINLVIGVNEQTAGYANGFNDVLWNSSEKFLMVELDKTDACTDFEEISNEVFNYVPFAFSAVNTQNVLGIVSIENGGTGASTVADAKINLELNNVENTNDLNKPISTATQSALNLKENAANKSTNVSTDGTSDVKFPTVKSVKTYVDAEITTSNGASGTAIAALKADVDQNESDSDAAETTLQNNINSLTSNVATNATTAATASAAVQTNVNANETASNTANTTLQSNIDALTTGSNAAIALKEDAANKSTNVSTDGTSDVKFPTVKSVKTYVDAEITTSNGASGTALATLQADVDQNESDSDAAETALQNNINTLTSNVATNATTAATASAAVQANVNANETASNTANTTLQNNINSLSNTTNAAIALKEDAANKSTNVSTDGTSDVKFPTVKSVKTYVDAEITTSNGASGTALATLQADVDQNESDSDAAETTLQNNINSLTSNVATNATTAETASAAVQTNVNANETASNTANTTLQSNIDALTTGSNAAIALKEDAANKSTNVSTDGTSDVKFPTVKSVKTYVDAEITTSNGASGTALATLQADVDQNESDSDAAETTLQTNINTLTSNVATNATTAATASAAVQANVNANETASNTANTTLQNNINSLSTNTNAAIALKENAANKSTDVSTDGTSDVKFPTVKSVKTYVDAEITTSNGASGTALAALKADVDQNESDSDAAETTLQTNINTLTSNVATNATTAATASAAVQANVNANETASNTANTTLQSNIDALTTGSNAAIAAVQLDVDNNEADSDAAIGAINTLADGKFYLGNVSNQATEVTLSGDVTIDNAGVATIGTSKVVSSMINDGTIVVGDLATDAIETAKIKDANVTNAKLDKANIPLSGFAATTSSELAGVISDETGTGSVVMSTSPTLVTPALGTPSALVGTNITGTAAGLTAGTVTANANLTGEVTSMGNASTVTNAAVIGKILTGYTAAAGTIAATDNILEAIQKLDGNNTTNANLTGPITSVGNATSVASQTGTGTKFVMDTTPTLVTPVLGVATATSINGSTIPSSKTLVVTTDKLDALSATTSSELAGVISDETGTGSLVLSASPTFTGTVAIATLIAGSNTYPTTSGSANQVLQTDGSGTLAWATPSTIATSYSGVLPIANGGTGSNTQNFVDLTSNQAIGGAKTFSSTITGNVTGNLTGNASGTALTVTQAAQTAITSVGTLTALQVDNINIDGNTISSTAGTDLNISPLAGQQIVLDGAIIIDAGVVTGATSITSSAFVGNVTGDVTGTSANVTGIVAVANGGTGLSAVGNNGQVLTTSSGALAWSTPASSGATNIDGLSDALVESNSLYIGNNPSSTSDNASYNVAVGTTALDAITTGDNNSALGYDALTANTSGYENTASGVESLYNNTSGRSNTAMGYRSLRANTTGDYNTASGVESMYSNTTGQFNSAFGLKSLRNNTTASYNTAIGDQALYNANRTADANAYNTALGYNAGNTGTNNITTGDKNVFLGASTAASQAAASNQIVIGYGATGAADNTVQLGNTSITNVKTSGTITAGAITIPNTDGTANQVLKTDGSGTLAWSTPASSVREVADEETATSSQTSFTLTQTPSANSKVKMYINGIRISNTAYSVSGTTLTYVPANNGSYALTASDRIQFDYYY